MKGRKRTPGNKLSRLFGGGHGRLLLDEQGLPTTDEVTEDQETEAAPLPVTAREALARLDPNLKAPPQAPKPIAPRPAEPRAEAPPTATAPSPVPPVKPAAPVAPTPAAPIRPAAPTPVAPVAPAAPVRPAAPTPVAPVAPAAPIRPAAPVAPAPVAAAPVAAAPVAPVRPAEPSRVTSISDQAARQPSRPDPLGRPHRGPATLHDVTPSVPEIPESLNSSRLGRMLLDDEGVEDEPTAPAASPARPRPENLARRAPEPPRQSPAPPASAAQGPAAGPSPTGFALLPHEEDGLDDLGGAPRPRETSLERAARVWADESLFDEPTPPAAVRRPELSVLPGRGEQPETRGRGGFQLLQDEDSTPGSAPPSSGPAVYINDGGPPARPRSPSSGPVAAAAQPAQSQPRAQAPRPSGAPPRAAEGPEDRTGPLRVFLGTAGAEGPSARKAPPADVSGPIWDATVVAFRRYDTDDMLARADEDAPTEEDIEAAERRASGQLPRTWLDPARLPPSLDRNHGARPRRVGGVVQPVPGTPSALAIAREEAESARLPPPPPLVSPPPVLMSSAWATPEPEPPEAAPAMEPAGFQLLPEPAEVAPRETPSMVVGDAPPVPRQSDRLPQRVENNEGSSVAIYATIGALLVLLVGGALLFMNSDGLPSWKGGRDAETTQPPEPPKEVLPPLVDPALVDPALVDPPADPPDDAASTVAPDPKPVPAPPEPPTPKPIDPPVVASQPVAANPCDAPADTPFTGQLEIISSSKGTVYVDDKRCGTIPLARPIRLTNGPHKVRLSGSKGSTQTIRIDAERMTRVVF